VIANLGPAVRHPGGNEDHVADLHYFPHHVVAGNHDAARRTVQRSSDLALRRGAAAVDNASTGDERAASGDDDVVSVWPSCAMPLADPGAGGAADFSPHGTGAAAGAAATAGVAPAAGGAPLRPR